MLIEEAKKESVGTIVKGLDVVVTTAGQMQQADKALPKKQKGQKWVQKLGLQDASGHTWGVIAIDVYKPIIKSSQILIEEAEIDEFVNKKQQKEKLLRISQFEIPAKTVTEYEAEQDAQNRMEGVLDTRVERVLQKYDIPVTEAVWPMKRKDKKSGIVRTTWLIYHRYCEEIAAKAHVTFEPPELVPTNSDSKSVAVLVTGHWGYSKEWSYGEATPDNTKVPYPFAMAEKRAKDRVILKLVGLHGFVYGEDEEEWSE